MLEHVRQAALARGVVHVAGINKGVVAEDRRLVPLANDQREPVGQDFDGDSLLKALQILSDERSNQRIRRTPEEKGNRNTGGRARVRI